VCLSLGSFAGALFFFELQRQEINLILQRRNFALQVAAGSFAAYL
jgi:hypothetical protein